MREGGGGGWRRRHTGTGRRKGTVCNRGEGSWQSSFKLLKKRVIIKYRIS